MRKLKTRMHFNRVNMQRGDNRVWTAHTSRACHMARKIVIVHNGETVAQTVFDPEGRQPRAYFETKANVQVRNGVAYVSV